MDNIENNSNTAPQSDNEAEEVYRPTDPILYDFSSVTNYTDVANNSTYTLIDDDSSDDDSFSTALTSIPDTQIRLDHIETISRLMIEDLEDVSDEVFFETGWKIVNIIRAAALKDRRSKMRNRSSTPVDGIRHKFSSSESSSVIILSSPSRSPSPGRAFCTPEPTPSTSAKGESK